MLTGVYVLMTEVDSFLMSIDFTQTDPMPYGPGTAFESSYVYGRNSPLVFVDPTGLRAASLNNFLKQCAANRGAAAPNAALRAAVAGRGSCLYGATTQGAGGAIEISANASSATSIAIYLGATGSNLGNWGGIAGRVKALQVASGDRLATVAYQWFDAPQGVLDAGRTGPSAGSGQQLSEFIAALQKGGKRVTLIGHSWGGLVANEAVRQGSQPDGLVLMGSLASPNSFGPVRSMMNFRSSSDDTESIARAVAPSYRTRSPFSQPNKGGVLQYDSNDECRAISYCVVGSVSAATGHSYMEDSQVLGQVARYALSR
jgi:Alpha/beta hydrolase